MWKQLFTNSSGKYVRVLLTESKCLNTRPLSTIPDQLKRRLPVNKISALSINTIEKNLFLENVGKTKENYTNIKTLPRPIFKIRKIIEDIPKTRVIIENPKNTLLNEIRDIIQEQQRQPFQEMPSMEKRYEKIEAARLIVIRRRKMKKHKLRKLRKKMKFEWAKVRQRREMRKEKAFQGELIAQIKEAERFSAETYVADKLRQANETPIPRFWKGRRLPQFIIKQKLGIK